MEINILEIIGVVLGVGVLSFVVKPNPIQRVAESLYVGFAAGYLVVINFNNAYRQSIIPMFQDPSLILPLILCLLLFTRLSKKYSWLSNYPTAFLTALGIGVAVRTIVETNITKQIISSALPLFVPNNAIASVNNIIILISTLTVLSYFIYGRKPGKFMSVSSNIGIYFMMVAFGSTIAASILGRVSRMIGFLQTVILVPSGLYMVPISIILIYISLHPEKIGLKKENK